MVPQLLGSGAAFQLGVPQVLHRGRGSVPAPDTAFASTAYTNFASRTTSATPTTSTSFACRTTSTATTCASCTASCYLAVAYCGRGTFPSPDIAFALTASTSFACGTTATASTYATIASPTAFLASARPDRFSAALSATSASRRKRRVY